jgi:hypothetical protein
MTPTIEELAELEREELRQEIIAAMQKHGGPMSPMQIAQATSGTLGQVQSQLRNNRKTFVRHVRWPLDERRVEYRLAMGLEVAA